METLIIGTLALVSVCLWTLRIEITTRGHRRIAVPLAAVEAMVYVTAFARVLDDLGAPERVLAFGIGVAAGTYIAMVVADRAIGRKPEGAVRSGTGSGPDRVAGGQGIEPWIPAPKAGVLPVTPPPTSAPPATLVEHRGGG